MLANGTHSKMVHTASLKVSQGAGHGQWQGFHGTNLLPQVSARSGGLGFLIRVQQIPLDINLGAFLRSHLPG